MRDIPRVAFSSGLLLLVDVLLCSCLVGCSEPATPGLGERSILDQSEANLPTLSDRPPTAKTLYAVADILAKQGRDSECSSVLRRIIQEYPQFLPAYNSLAQLQMRQGRPEEAMQTICAGLRLRPKEPVLSNNLGVCWLTLREYEKALDAFAGAVEAVPKNARYRANMAVALGLWGRYDESMSLYRQVLTEEEANHNVDILREARMNAQAKPTSPSDH
jgi:Flp pilus assembly protein TadD